MRLLPHSIVLAVLLWGISRCLFFTADGSVATIFTAVWGDWALHSAHAWWFAEQPVAAWLDPRILRFDESFAYPPLINFMSGMLLRSGFGLQAAMLLPCVLFAGMLGVALNFLYRRYGAGAWLAGLLPLVLLLAGGTRTIAHFFAWVAVRSGLAPGLDPVVAPGWLEALEAPADHVLLSQSWHIPLFTLMLPQRTFLAGVALGAVTLLAVLRSGHTTFPLRPRVTSILLGVLLPLLALAHIHSWLAICVFLGVIIAREMWTSRPAWMGVLRRWGNVTGPGLALSVLLIVLTMPSIGGKAAGFGWSVGWMAGEVGKGGQAWPVFWLVNWNFILPMALVAAAVSPEFRRDPCFITGALIFAAMNVVKLQPWSWDNSKLLFWALLFISLPLTRFFMRMRSRWLAVICAILFCIDGAAVLGKRLVQQRAPLVLWGPGEMAIAARTRQQLPLDALILSPSHRDHRYWSFALTGRRNVQAYGGWLWTHGLPVEPMQSRLDILLGAPGKNIDAIRGLGITHIAAPERPGQVKIGFDELNHSFNPLISFANQSVFAVPQSSVKP